MLSEIYIKNYILVPELRMKFGPGLTVISGETGAGKSILVGSVALIFGDSATGLEAFDPAQPIYLEACFLPAMDQDLQDYLAEISAPNDDELVLAREISAGGKSSYYIGGRKVSAQVIKKLRTMLLDFHHQRDQQKLLNSQYQLEILDRYAGTVEICKEFGLAYREIRRKQQLLDDMLRQEEKNRQMIDLYQYQFDELEKAELKTGEDIHLQQEYELQSHSKEILDLAHGMNTGLFEADNSIFDRLGSFQAQLDRYRNLNQHIEEACSSLFEAREALRVTSSALSALLDTMTFDPSRLDRISNRLDLINSLLHKHKAQNVEELLQLFRSREKEIADADDFRQQISQLQLELDEDAKVLAVKADELSELRSKASIRLAAELQHSIRHLALEHARVQIEIDKKANTENVMSAGISAYTESGQDAVEILFSANPGSRIKPLAKVASGGELSRILLGIKQVLARGMLPKLLILDEIDAGVGGQTAELMAAAISEIARLHPVLCITHLAQIAAYANTHIAVEKVSGDKTCVSLRVLNSEERTRELARMLSGHITEHALKHADELRTKQRIKEDISEQNK